jgi:integrase
MGLVDAGKIWLAGKKSKGRSPKTLECCELNLNHLILFFGDMPLRQFEIGSFIAYRAARQQGIGVFEENGPVGVSAINHELNVLQQLLRRAGLYAPIKDFYGPLPEPDWKPPKTFTMKEEEIIFDTAASSPEVELAEIVFCITRNTTASGSELRAIHLRDLEMDVRPPRIHITREGTKNNIRPRVIPLNAEAEAAFRRAIDRANRLGSHRPEHYLFPFRINRKYYDPNRPASKSWLRKQTDKLRAATGINHIRPHAFRHLAVTELLESGAPEQTVIAIAGWVSRNMINTYSHARIEAKADALKMLEKIPPQAIPAASKKIIQFPRK